MVVLLLPTQILTISAQSSSSSNQFSAELSGDNEVPPIATDDSGTASFSISNDIIFYTIETSGVEVSMGHLHDGEEGSNGYIVATLDVNNLADASISPSDLTGPLEGKTIDDLAELMEEGMIYVNLHTDEYADGYLRGQVRPTASVSEDQCLWPQCYVPYDDIQQYGTDDNCKPPDCLIRLEDGVQITPPQESQQPTTTSRPSSAAPPSTGSWTDKCMVIRDWLLNSCDFYTNSDGTLNSQGERAYKCILGGGFLGLVGSTKLPPSVVIDILEGAAKFANCDGIVDFLKLKSATDPLSFLRELGIK